MGNKRRQMRDFACITSALDDGDARVHMHDEMKQCGARGSGCLLLQAPLWLLLALAAVVCWLVYAACERAAPSAVEMAILGGILVPAGVAAARRWRYYVYYLAPRIIGRTEDERLARGWVLMAWGLPSLAIVISRLVLGFSPLALMVVLMAISLANVALMLGKARGRRGYLVTVTR